MCTYHTDGNITLREQRGLESSPCLERSRGKVNEVRPSLISISLILFLKDFHVQNIICATIFKDVA